MIWVKAFHIVFMVTWFAGLFYLPRLFVYHAMTTDQVSNERFKVMERKLYFGIMTPGAILTILTGIWMLLAYAWEAYGQATWLHLKIALVGLLLAYHIYCGKLLFDFSHNRNHHNPVFYRWFNEFPVVILIAIVVLVIVRPF